LCDRFRYPTPFTRKEANTMARKYDMKVILEVFEEEGIGPYERDMMEELDRIESRTYLERLYAR
jgi:hypothetical protein